MPSPPQKDRSYSFADLTRRAGGQEADSESSSSDTSISKEGPTRDGWVKLGHGQDVTFVQLSASEDFDIDSPAQRPELDASMSELGVAASSKSSSRTTISQPSPPPSLRIIVSSAPPYDPIDIGDEGQAGEEGQKDRSDGQIDEVFKLHSSRRMKPTSKGRGVSIPSREFHV